MAVLFGIERRNHDWMCPNCHEFGPPHALGIGIRLYYCMNCGEGYQIPISERHVAMREQPQAVDLVGLEFG